jgi:RNA recognition motif-containing protein
MSKRIFVGGLPYSTTDQELTDLFASVGNVKEAVIITDRMTGQSKGFGFVEMESDSEAETAIRTLNETVLGGRTLKVNEANERPARQNNRNFNSSRW